MKRGAAGGALLAVVSAVALPAGPAAAANVPRVLVVAPAAPVQIAGHPIQVPVYARNVGADVFCPTAVVRVRWSYDGRTWDRIRSVGAAVQGETTLMRIPARAVVQGVLRYAVTVDQECGVLLSPPSGVQWFSGRWPATGTAKVIVVSARRPDPQGLQGRPAP